MVALRAITSATAKGSWVLLQNCHLGLAFIDTLEDLLVRMRSAEGGHSQDFRLFITTEPHEEFSIGLLQVSLKVTNEPPKGLRAGLIRSYTVIIDQDRLERIDSPSWRMLLYTLCFTHSVVQERRKFGSLGWSVAYEFNDGDLNATIMFLEKHLEHSALSWSTLQYMTAEVQYGGRITDNMDRLVTLSPHFIFIPTTRVHSFFPHFLPLSLLVRYFMLSYVMIYCDVL